MVKDAAWDVEVVASAIQLLADPTRLKILFMLADHELNVTALQDRLDCPQPTVSHHLGLLRTANLVQARRAGKRVFYRLGGVVATPEGLRVSAGDAEVMLRVDRD
jgi:DNA-binding transcriptional ArsR family regulator